VRSELLESFTGKYHLHAAAGIVAALCSTILCSCFGHSPTGPERETDIRFPLDIGNTWVYHCAYDYSTIAAGDTTHDSGKEEATWRIAALEEVRGQMAYRMEISQKMTSGPDSGKSITYSNWYVDHDSTLVALASEFVEGKGSFQDTYLSKISYPQGEINDWSVTVLRYPLTLGSEWRFSSLRESDFKKVESRERIIVNEREYDTFRIVRDFDGMSDNTPPIHFIYATTQWFAPEGLVKSMVNWTSYEDSATYSGISVFELISFTIR
jgi:hypothetical protein